MIVEINLISYIKQQVAENVFVSAEHMSEYLDVLREKVLHLTGCNLSFKLDHLGRVCIEDIYFTADQSGISYKQLVEDTDNQFRGSVLNDATICRIQEHFSCRVSSISEGRVDCVPVIEKFGFNALCYADLRVRLEV